jgi:hypothetical protein
MRHVPVWLLLHRGFIGFEGGSAVESLGLEMAFVLFLKVTESKAIGLVA